MELCIVQSHSADYTKRLGRKLGQWLQAGDCIPLLGDMGSGKTCFVKGVAEGLEISSDVIINSPSFTLINQYFGRLPLYHVDLYRLNTAADLDDIELIDLIHGDGVTMIEWPQLILPKIPEIVLSVEFLWDMTSEFGRTITFSTRNTRFLTYFEELNDQNTRY